jgi:hypothetical protein
MFDRTRQLTIQASAPLSWMLITVLVSPVAVGPLVLSASPLREFGPLRLSRKWSILNFQICGHRIVSLYYLSNVTDASNEDSLLIS